MALRHTPIYEALYRPNLFLGGERLPMLGLAIACGGVAITSLDWIVTGVCAALWALGAWALREAAKADPQALQVWWRSRRQQRYYPARSRHWRFE